MKRSLVASLLLIAGGALKVPLWLLFTSLHGPTSFNESGEFLGADPLVWGAIMSAVPSLLVAAGLIGHWPLLAARTARRVGLILVLIALCVPAALDLATRVLWPPLLLPLLAAGALVIGLSGRKAPMTGTLAAAAFVVIGVVLAATYAYALSIPPAVFGAIDGYRLQGVFEHVLVALCWIAVGVGLLRSGQHRVR